MNKEQFDDLLKYLGDNSYENEFQLDDGIHLTVLSGYNTIVFHMIDFEGGYEATYKIDTDFTPLPDNVEEFNKLIDAIWYYNNVEVDF